MAGPPDHAAHHTPGRVPFWIHQLVELLVGMLLLVQGARTDQHTAVLVTFGGLLLLLAACSEGALAAWPWIGRRLHRVLDVVAAAVLALSPLALGLDDVLPIVILEVAAAAMVWLALRTEWRATSTRNSLRWSRPTSSPSTSPPKPSAPEVPIARRVGGAVGKARDDGPRQLGRFVGRARRAAKAAMAPDPTSAPSEGSTEPPGADSEP